LEQEKSAFSSASTELLFSGALSRPSSLFCVAARVPLFWLRPEIAKQSSLTFLVFCSVFQLDN
jgi:hypothetical protein